MPSGETVQTQPKPDACAIVIFGASGDLASRKLLPALFRLQADDVLNERSYILGGAGRRMFYLATPPLLAMTIVARLGESGLSKEARQGWTRVVLEKPFGSDLASAQRMHDALNASFRESQIYRIDHCLGKETVQNLLVFRFANAICEPIWNRNYIDHVQISVAETDGVGHRAGYFEQTGLLRDMVQNHLLQLLCLTAMEPPCNMQDCSMRDDKTRVLAAVKPLRPAECGACIVRGQYTTGRIDGREVVDYRREPGVAASSQIETFVALRLELDNWRWQGVPFYLRAGKRLRRRISDIVVQFKSVPAAVLRPLLAEQLSPNLLRFRLQPDEGIELRFEAKTPGPRLHVRSAALRFDYVEAFGGEPPEAYARLLLDVMLGDAALFLPQEWIEHAWRVLAPVMQYWAHSTDDLALYPAGSWGPDASDALLTREGRAWATL